MAIVFPLMFLVLAGIVDLGRAFFYQIQLTNAAREGARASVVSEDQALIEARAKNSAGALRDALVFDPNNRYCGDAVLADEGDVAKVKVSAPMEWYLLKPAMNIILAGNFPAGIDTLSSTAVMQCGG
jgi:Flp pilus assembly protein TadG